MKDPIERQAAIEALIQELYEKPEEYWDNGLNRYDIEATINALPPAQPEIIRCKECMNHGKEICYFWSHFYGTINTPDYGFCYKAERREE